MILINRRRAAQSGSPVLPYDAEVEYLEGQTSTTYVDTGVSLTSDMGMKIVFESTEDFQSPLCGVFGSSGGNLCIRFGAKKIFVNYDGSTYINTNINKSTTIDNRTTIIIDTDHNIIVNGQTVGQFTRGSGINEIPIYLFAANDDSSATSSAKIRVYEFSLFTPNGTLLDYIPVRIGQTGYMYDRISGQLFGNSGTGNFILGNDK